MNALICINSTILQHTLMLYYNIIILFVFIRFVILFMFPIFLFISLLLQLVYLIIIIFIFLLCINTIFRTSQSSWWAFRFLFVSLATLTIFSSKYFKTYVEEDSLQKFSSFIGMFISLCSIQLQTAFVHQGQWRIPMIK